MGELPTRSSIPPNVPSGDLYNGSRRVPSGHRVNKGEALLEQLPKDEGLPVGIQIAARPFHEELVLRFADAYERHIYQPSQWPGLG